MKPVTKKNVSQAIVYDGELLPDFDPEWFDAAHWRELDAVTGEAPGRGSSLFVATSVGPVVLRRYLRGGWAARFSKDRYRFRSVETSRPFLEFELLRRMHEDGLQVPRPLAALCDIERKSYRGALMTHRIPDVVPLDTLLDQDETDWRAIGAGLHGFHRSGVDHVDLNARNIMVGNGGEVWLLDFDRCRYTPGHPVDGQSNLRRLMRSLQKFWPAQGPTFEACWKRLLDGYGKNVET